MMSLDIDKLLETLKTWADEADKRADRLKAGSQVRAFQRGERTAYLRVANLLLGR